MWLPAYFVRIVSACASLVDVPPIEQSRLFKNSRRPVMRPISSALACIQLGEHWALSLRRFGEADLVRLIDILLSPQSLNWIMYRITRVVR